MHDIVYVVIALGFFVLLLVLALLPSYIRVQRAGGNITLRTIIGIKMCRIPIKRITVPLTRAAEAGIYLSAKDLESHYLVCGNADRVVDALIAAKRNNITLDFMRACAIDLSIGDAVSFVNSLAEQNKVFTETDVENAINAYLENQDKDMLAVRRMAKTS